MLRFGPGTLIKRGLFGERLSGPPRPNENGDCQRRDEREPEQKELEDLEKVASGAGRGDEPG